jgi:toxin ParE1/3/4
MPRARLPIVWSSDSEDDFFDIWGYLSREATPTVAERTIRDIEQKCQRLSEWPYSGRSRDDVLPGFRSIPVGSYVVFHQIEKGTVEIVRVLHGRRDAEGVFAKPPER